MKIKTVKKVMIGGYSDPIPKGSVVEANDEAEAKALIASGYAKATNEALSDVNTFRSVGGNTPKISGNVDTAEADGDAEADVLDGNIGEVTERLVGLDAAALKRLDKLESKGKDRQGVHNAIEAAVAALADNAE